MAAKGTRVTVTDAAPVKLAEAGRSITLWNVDDVESVALGGATVTFSTGFEAPGGTLLTNLDTGLDEVYAIADTGKSVIVHVLGVRRADR